MEMHNEANKSPTALIRMLAIFSVESSGSEKRSVFPYFFRHSSWLYINLLCNSGKRLLAAYTGLNCYTFGKTDMTHKHLLSAVVTTLIVANSGKVNHTKRAVAIIKHRPVVTSGKMLRITKRGVCSRILGINKESNN